MNKYSRKDSRHEEGEIASGRLPMSDCEIIHNASGMSLYGVPPRWFVQGNEEGFLAEIRTQKDILYLDGKFPDCIIKRITADLVMSSL